MKNFLFTLAFVLSACGTGGNDGMGAPGVHVDDLHHWLISECPDGSILDGDYCVADGVQMLNVRDCKTVRHCLSASVYSCSEAVVLGTLMLETSRFGFVEWTEEQQSSAAYAAWLSEATRSPHSNRPDRAGIAILYEVLPEQLKCILAVESDVIQDGWKASAILGRSGN